MKRFAACFAALVASACSPALHGVSDYCFTAQRPTLEDLCAEGVTPVLTPDGWGSCSLLTKSDGTRIAAEGAKYDDRCPRQRAREGL